MSGTDRRRVVPMLPTILPPLPPRLRAQVDRLIAGPTHYAGTTAEDPGLVIASSEPAYDPEVDASLAAQRAACEPASEATIIGWLETLAASLPTPPEAAVFDRMLPGFLLVLGELPGVVWDRPRLKAALTVFTYWPSIAKLSDLLEPHAAKLRRELRELERIAAAKQKAPPPPPPGAYDPGPAPPQRDPHASMPKAEDEAEIAEAGLKPRAQDAERTPEEQIATFTAEEIERSRAMAVARHAILRGEAKP